MMDRNKVVSSLAYKFTERLAVKGIGFVIGIILARLLAPEYFGIISILMVFINLSQTIVQSGFNSALVQSKQADDLDYSTAFYICMAMTIIMIVILWAFAPLISHFYDTTDLISPLRVMSLATIFGTYNSIQVAILQREMKFKETMYCGLFGTILSGLIGIILAYAGYGLWALVGYQCFSTIFSCAAMFFVIHWYPKLVFSIEHAKKLFSFGWKMLVAALVNAIYCDVRTLVIGKIYTKVDLAYYNRGQQYPDIIANSLNSSIQSVMFPVMSKMQDDIGSIIRVLRKSVSIGSLIIIPFMFWMAAIAEPFVSILLTDKWLPCVKYMQVLCVGFVTIPIETACLTAIKAIGRSDTYMKLEVVRRISMLVVLIISIVCFQTPFAIALGFVISAFVDVLIISMATNSLLNYGIASIIKDTWKVFFSSVLMFIISFIPSLIITNMWVLIVLQTAISFISYVTICCVMNANNFHSLFHLMISNFKNK